MPLMAFVGILPVMADKQDPGAGGEMVHGLWIGGSLSPLEQLTIASFRANGYGFTLWTYGEVTGVPEGTEVRDASQIIPESQVFSYRYANKYGHGKGSYAGFSDIFRYRLLYLYGGIWADMDMTCLRPLPESKDYLFRYHHKFGAVGNLMRCPAGAPVMEWCHNRASEQMNADNTRWELPIEILREGISRFGLDDAIIPTGHDDSWPVVARLAGGPCNLPADALAIHWMNEEWRRLRLPKDRFLAGSCLDSLLDRYHVKAARLQGLDALRVRWRISRPNYVWQSVKGRFGLSGER